MLVSLLKHVGNVIKVDQTTFLRLKSKFAHVCVNIDVTEPLSGVPCYLLQRKIYESSTYL